MNRTRWSGFAALALMGGLVVPVAGAPVAHAATVTVTNADCVNPGITGTISGAPGDVVDITANLIGCRDFFVGFSVSDSVAGVVVENGSGAVTPTTPGSFWLFSSASDFTRIEITLGTSNGTYVNGIGIGGNTGGTDWDVTISGSAPNPPAPTPTPATPPSAPTTAEATAGNGEATVSWTAPASQGSFPITNYQVQTTTGNLGCLVPATATSCRVAGLRNGTEYTFRVRALNGGGWGAWADAGTVTPGPGPEPDASIMISGSRSGNDRVARVKGETTGLSGATLQAMVQLSTQTEFAPGSMRTVDAQGEFTWKRRTPSGVSVEVYFTAGDITSNTISIASRS